MKTFIEAKSVLKELRSNILNLLRWFVIAAFVGIFVGSISAAFALLDLKANIIRNRYPDILFGLPFAGLFIVFIYKMAGEYNAKGTNLVISTIQARGKLSFRMAPLIFVSTVVTHLFGGSVGREGAALQLGSALAVGINKIKILKFSAEDRRMLIMCGMSAAFSAIFGTPIAAVFFPMEVISVGIMQYSALFPCFVSSLTASFVATAFKVKKENLGLVKNVGLSPEVALKVAVLAVICGLISILFCIMLKKTGEIFAKLHNRYIQVFLGGSIFVACNLLLDTTDFLGAGMPVIERAVDNGAVWYAFLLKMVFTAICIGSGFKGGEIVPSLFIGATFGSAFGGFLGLPVSLAAACGMAGLFVGVTNCPVSTLLIISELFGFREGSLYFVLAITISYIMSGYFGLYSEQNIIYSKFKTKFINRRVGEYEKKLRGGE